MERFIGIDLGTTYSSVATIDEYGKPVIVKNHNGESLTPSVIYFDEFGNTIVGSEAKELLQSGEENVAMFFKRFMGDDVFRFYAHDREYTAKELSAILLRKLKEDAEEALGGEVRNVVITVPAYFNDLQRSETVSAGVEAGFNVLRIINEPTAAAITYGISRSNNQRLLVYDLGGGTFDVTVLQITPDTIKVLATGGDHELGGKDWDDMLINCIVDQFRTEYGADPTESVEVYNDLAYDCEKLKKQLSSKESATISVRYNGMRGRYTITREKFEELTEAQLRSTKTMTEHVLEEAGLTWADLDGALLVGGSTRMPMVENWVRQMSGKEPLRGVNVDEAVSLGAAIQAGVEMQKRGSFRLGGSTSSNQQFRLVGSKKIVDVMSHSLGAVAVSEDGEKYVNSIIIQKNKPIPVTERKDFLHHTQKRQDNDLEVYLTQGESTEIRDCIVVGKYIFHGIDHISNGETIINIEYSYDENGLIVVNGTQQESHKMLQIEKVPIGDDMGWLYEKPRGKGLPLSIIIAVDLSGSMSGKPMKKAQDAALEFIKQIDMTVHRIGIMGFANKSKMFCSSTNNQIEAQKAVSRLDCNADGVGYGNSNNPLSDSIDIFASQPDTKNILIILTDGVWSHPKDAIKSSDYCRQVGYDVVAIGFGSADKKFLERISTNSENALMTNLDNLVDSFGSIAQEISQSGGASGLKWNK